MIRLTYALVIGTILYSCNEKSESDKVGKYQYGQLNQQAPLQTLQWGQLAGQWNCTTKTLMPDSTWREGQAQWAFRYILDGFAVDFEKFDVLIES